MCCSKSNTSNISNELPRSPTISERASVAVYKVYERANENIFFRRACILVSVGTAIFDFTTDFVVMIQWWLEPNQSLKYPMTVFMVVHALISLWWHKTAHSGKRLLWWHYPFFVIGLGAPITAIEALETGNTDQALEETRYFEILMESMPCGAIQLLAVIRKEDLRYDWTVIVSIISSVLSVGGGTAWYFSRGRDKGNLHEFTPLIENVYLDLFLGVATSFDYVVRVVSFWLFLEVYKVRLYLVLPPLFVGQVLLVYFVFPQFWFAAFFAWYGVFTNSVAYFAGVKQKFQPLCQYTMFWIEVIVRDGGSVVFAYLAWVRETSKRTAVWSAVVYASTAVTLICLLLLVPDTRRQISELPPEKKTATTEN